MSIFILIFFLLLAAYGFLIDYYRRAWNSIPEFRGRVRGRTRVSVIVPVRNEEENIAELLEMLYAQDYPRDLYEVVMVDDHSTDNSWEIMQNSNYPGITKIVAQLPEGMDSKKNAISTGVAMAGGELIVTTDADCRMGGSWISSIVAFYEEKGAQFIAAPVQMSAAASVLGVFQPLDFLTMQGITGASVSRRFHTMCNGANLAYSKRAFAEVNGFEGIAEIPSGDDMLLMHKIALRYPDQVFYLKSREAIVTTRPEKTWRDFLNQRIRWASKAVHFKDKKIFWILALTYVVNVFFVAGLAGALMSLQVLGFLLLFLFAKVLIEFPFVNSVSGFFGQRRLMKYFILLQPLHILYIVVSGWLGRFGSYTGRAEKFLISGMLRSKTAIVGLAVIIACIVLAVFAYFIAPDGTPYANRMIVEIGGQKPGFRQQFLKVPKESLHAPASFFGRLAGGEVDNYYYVPVARSFVRSDSLVVDKYVDEEVTERIVYPLEMFEGGKPELVSKSFLLGTDKYGRDILSRLIVGVR